MANPINGYGYRFVKSLLGDSDRFPTMDKFVANAATFVTTTGTTTVDLRPGDAVKLVNDGSVTLADDGDRIYGVVAACYPSWDGKKMVYQDYITSGTTWGAAGTDWDKQTRVAVIPAADMVFAVHASLTGTTTAFAPTTRASWEAIIGENVDQLLVPSSTLRQAVPKLDMTTHNTTSSQWRIVGISPVSIQYPGIDWTLKDVELWVTVNETAQAPYYTTGV